MKLYIKQKPLSWRDKFTAKDENGNDRYTMQGGKASALMAIGKNFKCSIAKEISLPLSMIAPSHSP